MSVGRNMVLAGVEIEVLVGVPEVQPQHVAVGAGAHEASVQVHSADRPAQGDVQRVQRGVALCQRPLVGQVEGPASHALQGDVLHPGSSPGEDLDGRVDQRGDLEVRRQDLVHKRYLAQLLRYDENAGEGGRAGARHPATEPDGALETDPARDPEEDAIAPQGRVQRGELAVGGGHGLGGQERLDLSGPVPGCFAQRRKNHALRGERLVEFHRDDRSVHVDDPTGAVPVLLHRTTQPIRDRIAIRRIVTNRTRRRQFVERELPRHVRVAPLLGARGRHRSGRVDIPRVLAAGPEPRRIGGARLEHGPPVDGPARAFARDGDLAHPTLPSISNSISRLSSTAYSSGSSFAMGSMNPRTISAMASASSIPRLIR